MPAILRAAFVYPYVPAPGNAAMAVPDEPTHEPRRGDDIDRAHREHLDGVDPVQCNPSLSVRGALLLRGSLLSTPPTPEPTRVLSADLIAQRQAEIAQSPDLVQLLNQIDED